MCGIAGLWGTEDRHLVDRMLEGLTHRGPDGCGVHVQSGAALGHRRLAIMDPEGGAQPLYDEKRDFAIVANGEIYNFPAIRPDLASRHSFATSSDNEAIVHLFEERDAATPAALAGMFAFAIAGPGRLFLARDPIGIKPLYCGRGTDSSGAHVTAFASEMAPLADWVDELHEFPAGHWWDSRVGLEPYYRLPDGQPTERPIDDQVARVRRALETAVESHLMSDVPVGAFLSGGLDSSVIAALAARRLPQLHTFSVGVAGSTDLQAARTVAEHIGSTHHEYEITAAEIRACLPEIVRTLESFDQDLVRSAIPTYFCARLASDHVKVILTGEGADELFAGYAYHRDIADPAVLHQELRRSIATLHNVNLQRVDRLTMLHGVEARVPFLDTAFIELALSVPADVKLARHADGTVTEKWILRRACEDLVPTPIAWRTKQQFDEGSGTLDLLDDALEPYLETTDLASYRSRSRERVRSHEEAVYHRLLSESFARPEMVLRNVARWTEDRYT